MRDRNNLKPLSEVFRDSMEMDHLVKREADDELSDDAGDTGDASNWAENNVEKVSQNLGLKRWQVVAAVIGEIQNIFQLLQVICAYLISISMFVLGVVYVVYLEVPQEKEAKR